MENKFLCEKYKQTIDINKNPCPHPNDYCQFRTRCIINHYFKEAKDCTERRRKKIEDT